MAQIADRIAAAADAAGEEGRGIASRLATLGTPEDVVRAVDGHVPGTGVAAMEIAAVVLLVIGGLKFLPAWVVGVVLLWASPRWERSDKLLGTLIWPGGLAIFRLLLLRPAVFAPRLWASYPPLVRPGFSSYTYLAVAHAHPIAWWLLLAVLAIPPVLVAIRLLRRARLPEKSRAA